MGENDQKSSEQSPGKSSNGLTKRFLHYYKGGDFENDNSGQNKSRNEFDTFHQPKPQFRLEASRKAKQKYNVKRFTNILRGKSSGTRGGIGMNRNHLIANTLHWMFRVNFLFLFAVMCIFFFVLVLIFSGLIIGAGKIDADCVKIGGISFGNTTQDYFADAFALSWTTFSTVGYGSTYPSLSHENESDSHCLFITLLCSLESFVGVLYSGLCGAIFFGKVLRIQSHAQVMFSDPIVIRYGSGVDAIHESDNDDDDEKGDGIERIPCPVLEFRVVNRLYAEVGGEIMDGTMNVIANVDANDVADDIGPSLQISASGTSDMSSEHSAIGEQENSHRFLKSTLHSIGHFGDMFHKRHHTIDEDPNAKLMNKRIFSKMIIEASDHPFFKRVWVGRHILDDTSPIVKAKVRRQIRKHKGYWPTRLNNYEGIRDSLQFNQILVSLNGVSYVSASDVYAQKIYDFVDINIGYQFVNILYKDSDGALKVDTDLLNDVREQRGGGGEPLIVEA